MILIMHYSGGGVGGGLGRGGSVILDSKLRMGLFLQQPWKYRHSITNLSGSVLVCNVGTERVYYGNDRTVCVADSSGRGPLSYQKTIRALRIQRTNYYLQVH